MNKIAVLMISALLACGNAAAADPVRQEKVELAQGAPLKKLSGKIKGYASVEYSVAVPAGAVLSIALKSANRSNYFNVRVEGAEEALFVGSRDGDRFRLTAPAAGVYKVSVYLMRNAARRNEQASYVLEAGVGLPDGTR